MKESLLSKLREIDQEKGRAWILEKTGIQRSHMSQFINSKRPISIEKLVGILERCGVEIVLEFKKG